MTDKKAIAQFRLQVGGVLKPLRMYGQDHYVDTAIPIIVELALKLHERLNGNDVPIEFDHRRVKY